MDGARPEPPVRRGGDTTIHDKGTGTSTSRHTIHDDWGVRCDRNTHTSVRDTVQWTWLGGTPMRNMRNNTRRRRDRGRTVRTRTDTDAHSVHTTRTNVQNTSVHVRGGPREPTAYRNTGAGWATTVVRMVVMVAVVGLQAASEEVDGHSTRGRPCRRTRLYRGHGRTPPSGAVEVEPRTL